MGRTEPGKDPCTRVPIKARLREREREREREGEREGEKEREREREDDECTCTGVLSTWRVLLGAPKATILQKGGGWPR